MSLPRSEIFKSLISDITGEFTARDIMMMWPYPRRMPSSQEVAGLIKAHGHCEIVRRSPRNGATIYRRIEE